MPGFLGQTGVPSVAGSLPVVRGFASWQWPDVSNHNFNLDVQLANTRIEGVATTHARLRWSYTGTGTVTIWRSTDGVVYSALDTVAYDSTTTKYTYDDYTPTHDVKYWYKLSDDNQITSSAVVTLVVKSGATGDGNISTMGLPRV